MEAIARAFELGAFWMYSTLIWGLVHWALVGYQLLRRREKDLVPYLFAGMAVTVLWPLLGTIVGTFGGFHEAADLAADARLWHVVVSTAISLNTLALGLLFAIPGFIATGIAAVLVKKNS